MPRYHYPVIPGSLRQRVLAAVPTVGSKSAKSICDELGLTERRDRCRACSTLQDLVTDGHLEHVSLQPREGRWGRPSRTYRRLPEPDVLKRRSFLAARRLVEAYGFVLVPRRPL